MDYKELNEEFKKKYNSQIVGIALKSGVDMNTATDMFKSNLYNYSQGVADKTVYYPGAGVVGAETMGQMVKDYLGIKDQAVLDTVEKGRGDLLKEKVVEVQEELKKK